MRQVCFFLLFAMFQLTGFTQDNSTTPGTTLEEYNYATKGYKTTLDQGLDVKKGYKIRNLSKQPYWFKNNTNHKIQPVLLLRTDKTDKEYAAVMFVITNGTTVEKVVCVVNPTTDLTIRDASLADLWTLTGPQRNLFDYALSRIYAWQLTL